MNNDGDFDWDRDALHVMHSLMWKNCRNSHIPTTLYENQTNSYNDFLKKLEKLIRRYLTIKVVNPENNCQYFTKVKDVHYFRPDTRERDDSIGPNYPNISRLRNMTYSGPVSVTIEHGYSTNGREFDTKVESAIVLINRLPVMVGSKLCRLHGLNREQLLALGESWMDPGGFFVIKGNEKVIIPQERIADNSYACFAGKGAIEGKCEIRATINQTYFYVKPTKVTILRKKPKQKLRAMIVDMPLIKESVPLFVVFRALGVVSDREITEMILHDVDLADEEIINLLRQSAVDAHKVNFKDGPRPVLTQMDALEFMGELMKHPPSNKDMLIKQLRKLIITDLFTNAGHSNIVKAKNLAYMARRLLDTVLGRRPFDDRDDLRNKRCDLAGPLLVQIAHANLVKLNRSLRHAFNKHLYNKQTYRGMRKLLQANNIEQRITYALSTGNWVLNNVTTDLSDNKKGIAQIRGRISHISMLSNIRRVKSPLDDNGAKVVGPRRYHSSQVGANDIAETPEGKEVGVVKNLALSAHITIESNPQPIHTLIIDYLGAKPIEHSKGHDLANGVQIILNGCIIAVVPNDDAHEFYTNMRILKRHTTAISSFISIAWFYEYSEIVIETGAGRYARPLYVVNAVHDDLLIAEKGRWQVLSKKLNWVDFLVGHGLEEGGAPTLWNGGVIEYLDVAEQETHMIAYNRQMLLENTRSSGWWNHYTHCEINPLLLLGVVSGVIPMPDHNQSPRNCYQCLDKNELVLMSTGDFKRIADIKIGDKVVSVDPVSLKSKVTTVINQYVKSTEKAMVEISTISGRKMVCTDDHPVLTLLDGIDEPHWIPAGKLDGKAKIATIYTRKHYLNDVTGTILTSAELLARVGSQVSMQRRLMHTTKLKHLGLLPLQAADERTPILAGMLGFTMTDGSAGIYSGTPQIQLTFGSHTGCMNFQHHVKTLGFVQNTVTKVYSEGYGTCWQVIYSNEFASLLIALGAPLGKKTVSPTPPIPDWIQSGSMKTKQMFLAGFQGGDGCKVRCNKLKGRKSPNYVLNTTSKQKCKKHLDTLIAFMTQLGQLFGQFDIVTKELFIKKSEAYDDRYIVGVPFECSRDNIVQYYDTIGYLYDNHKVRESMPIVEYLRHQQQVTEDIDLLKLKVTTLRFEEKTYPEIGEILGISDSYANTLYRARNMKSRMPNNHVTFDDWCKLTKQIDEVLFVAAGSIVPVSNREIADITVDDEVHSFVTGSGICVHNSSMSKQSLGWFDVNYSTLMLNAVNYLQYPSRPLTATQAHSMVGLETLFHAYQAIVAIMAHGGFNQEDSLLVNGSATERGAFMSIRGRNYYAERTRLKTPSSKANVFGLPPKNSSVKNPRSGRARAEEILNAQGYPEVGTRVRPHDVVIGKYSAVDDPRFDYIDQSVTVNKSEGGVVTRVIPSPEMPNVSTKTETGWIATNEDGQEFCRVMVEHIKTINIADKFASTSAQKGTGGAKYTMIDMPFTEDGVVPDLVKNPHAVPSRMTIAQTLELPIAKAAALTGRRVDVTAFTELNPIDGPNGKLRKGNQVKAFSKTENRWLSGLVTALVPNKSGGELYEVTFDTIFRDATTGGDEEDSDDNLVEMLPRERVIKSGLDSVGDVLEEHGYQRFGDEIMYSGLTGEMLKTDCTIGPTVYQKLRHMVDDKWHARNGGPVQLLTHQPAEGRSRDGGLRLGEMERDCFLAHGTAGILKERMMDCSDPFRVDISEFDRTVIQSNPDRGLFLKHGMQITDDHIYEIHLPYAADLFRKEMRSAGIDIKLDAHKY